MFRDGPVSGRSCCWRRLGAIILLGGFLDGLWRAVAIRSLIRFDGRGDDPRRVEITQFGGQPVFRQDFQRCGKNPRNRILISPTILTSAEGRFQCGKTRCFVDSYL